MQNIIVAGKLLVQMEQLYPTLIIVLFTLLAIVTMGLIYFAYQFQKVKRDSKSKSVKKRDYFNDPFIMETCHEHPDKIGKGVCSICSVVLCEDCVKEHDGLNFCFEHFKLYVENNWQSVDSVITTPDSPELAMPLYQFKSKLWKEELPTLIRTHYKINIENDQIESHVSLLVREDDFDKVDERWKQHD